MWRLPVLASAAVVACAIAAASAYAAGGDLTSAQIVAALDSQRAASGIPPVREDATLAAGCAAYDEYVIRNGLQVADQHFENPRLPGYTVAGDRAARTSVLAYEPASALDALVYGEPFRGFGWAYGDPWDDAAFHLFQLMNPALEVSGGDERTATLADGETVRLECLSTFAGPFRRPPSKLRVYFYPGPGSAVATSEPNLESGPVLGIAAGAYGPPLIFAYFFGAERPHPHISSQRLTIGGASRPFVAAYAGGLSGPARIARASTAGLSNPSAGFYSKLPAEVVRSTDESEERAIRETIQERKTLTEDEEKAESEAELRSLREAQERAAAREAEETREQEAELRIGYEHGESANDAFHIKGP